MSGCAANQVTINHAYDAYSYDNSYTNQTHSYVARDFFASDLCVTNSINFGTDQTDSQVAESAGAFNLTTNEVLYNQNIFEKRYPASTTKILTAYIILKDCSNQLNDIVTISATAADQPEDASVCGLKEGDNITVLDLLYGMMLVSGNDAADALAEYHSGSVESFASVMIEEAYKLGATQSNFTNPSGMPDENHYTTVYDMYLIFQAAIEQPKFIEIVNTKAQTVSYSSASGSIVEKTYSNGNRYISGSQAGPDGFEIIGGKTGTTGAAGYCLVLYSKNPDGEDIISIVFKADGKHNLYLLSNQILSRFAK